MADWDDERDDLPARRRFPDPIALIVGIITLGVSGWVLSDGAWGLPNVDPRWLVAGGALVVGLLLLGASLRPRSRR
jgi:protein-S-isoprenylcysteine O-methyltransferase Ste14